MSNYLTTINGRSAIELYDDGHAEIILRTGQRAMIDIEDADRCKDRGWYINSRTIRSTDSEGVVLNRFLMNVTDPDRIVRVVDGNILNCRKTNLVIGNKTDKSDVSAMPNPVIIYKNKNYAELVLINNKNNEEVRAKIDLDDVDKVKNIRWTYSASAIQNNANGCICLHRYIMNASKDVYVKFRNGDKTDCRKANLYIESKYKDPVSKPIAKSNTKTPKGVADLGNGFFFVSIYNEKTSTLDQVGTFSNKEEAFLAYEKRVREICEELARDAYESLVASLMEQYYE